MRKQATGGAGSVAMASDDIPDEATVAIEGSTVRCPACQRPGPPQRRFCGGCGQSLWQACPQCGQECAADERFCSACGADVVTFRQEQLRERRQRLEQALALRARHDYDGAIAILRPLAREADPRFAPLRVQAHELLARLEAEQRGQITAAGAALETARAHLAAYDYSAAAKAIDSVPAALQTGEHQLLLERARQAESELKQLLGEIRGAIGSQQTRELLPKLDRLLVLKPDHAQARGLARQLCDQAVKSAARRLAEHRYADAIERLQQIPAALRDDASNTLYDAAAERHALRTAIEGASVADATLIALAQRLCGLAPDDLNARRLRDKALECPAQNVAGPPLKAAEGRSSFGGAAAVRVEHLACLRRASATGAVAQRLEEHAGELLVALGLALQGVGLAAVAGDLTPADHQSLRRKVAGLGFRLRGAETAWGLDLGEFALKAIKLAKGKGDEVLVKACEYVPHERPLAELDDPAERARVVERTLREFATRAGDLHAGKVGMGMPGQRVLGRFFELPPMPLKKAADAVAYEARSQFPMALEDLCWAYHVFAAPDQAGRQQVVVHAARQIHVRDRLALFQQCGVPVDLVQSDCVALHNAMLYALFDPRAEAIERDQFLGAFDVGTSSTNVVFGAANGLWFRTIGLGGGHVTDALARHFAVSSLQADEWKRQPAKAESFHRWQAAVAQPLDQLADELVRSLRTYLKMHADRDVPQRLYALGGGSRTFGLLEAAGRQFEAAR